MKVNLDEFKQTTKQGLSYPCLIIENPNNGIQFVLPLLEEGEGMAVYPRVKNKLVCLSRGITLSAINIRILLDTMPKSELVFCQSATEAYKIEKMEDYLELWTQY